MNGSPKDLLGSQIILILRISLKGFPNGLWGKVFQMDEGDGFKGGKLVSKHTIQILKN